MVTNLLPHQSLPPTLNFSGTRNKFRQKSSLSPHSTYRRRTQYIVCVSKSPDDTKPKRSSDDYHATLRALNSKGRRAARKSLGQHYMLNSEINEQLASMAGVQEGDVVLEIGPGTGSLTNVLLNAGATVLGIEKVAKICY